MDRKAQGAVEFTLIIAFVIFIFILIFGILAEELQFNQKQVGDSIAESVLDLMHDEIIFAKSKEAGFSRYFKLPAIVNGENYTLQMVESQLILNVHNKEYVKFIDTDVNGSINIQDSLNENMTGIRITKLTGEMIVEHCANCGYSYFL